MICSVTNRDVIRTRKEINKPNLYDRLEVLIPSKRPIRPMNDMSLSEILLLHYGIGASCAHLLSINSGYHPFIKYSMVSATVPMQKVEHFFTRNRSFLDYDLQKLRNAHIKELIHKLTYRGSRHRNGYPVRGQRTRSNYSTSKKRISTASRIKTKFTKPYHKHKYKKFAKKSHHKRYSYTHTSYSNTQKKWKPQHMSKVFLSRR